jgi:hypothetical protein
MEKKKKKQQKKKKKYKMYVFFPNIYEDKHNFVEFVGHP